MSKLHKTPGDTSWFVHDRFGMFIHWGLYALPARHEWVKTHERTRDEVYDRYLKYFDPDLYDPRQWAKVAKAAGMRYAVLTTKHHEGFCLFDSAYTDYKSTNTPAGRDLVKEFVEAFRAEGLKVGFYYSLIDWHHPDFLIDPNHPRRDDPDVPELNKGRDMKKYAQYMRDQVRELLTNYGKIHLLWLDFSYPGVPNPNRPWLVGKGAEDWEAKELTDLARSIQPGIMINNRSGLEMDLWTPEQYQPTEPLRHPVTGDRVVWEACQTFSGSWGYHRDEASWKSPRMLIEMLIQTVSLGGNLLMNVGPTARGYFDYRAEAALDAYAQWMKYNSRSIYGCDREEEFVAPNGCRYTRSADGKRLYVHLMNYPFAYLELPGLAGKVEYVQFLHDASELRYTEGEVPHFSEGRSNKSDLLIISMPVTKPNVEIPVVEIFLK